MEIENMIKIGDTVKVTGTRGMYSTYKKMADLMGSTLYKDLLYPKSMKFEVVEKQKHHRFNEMVYLLKNNEGEFLFTDKEGEIIVLSKPKPRTKTEFVKVEFEKLSDLVLAYESGDAFYCEDSVGNKNELSIYGAISMHRHSDDIYRKVEAEIDERQEFIDAYASLRHKFHGQRTYDDFSGFMYDSGKFKLVEK